MIEKEHVIHYDSDEDLDISVKKYMRYVNSQISKIKSFSKLIEDGQIIPEKLNKCIAEYENILLAIVGEYQRVKTRYRKIKREYKIWYDKIFLKARDKLNKDVPASKTISKKEIDSQATVDNEEMYRQWQEDLDTYDMLSRYLIRMIDSWNKEDKLLITLSNNMRSEMRALQVAPICNGINNPDYTKRIPVE